MVGLLSQRRYILQQLVNDPEILPTLAPGYNYIDMKGFFARPGSIMLGDLDGAALFALIEPGVYEGHYVLHPRRPGNVALCRGFLRTMFTEHAAQAIWGHVPIESRAARSLSRLLGFAPQGTSLSATGRSCVDYVLERTRWATLSGESLEA